MKKFGLLIILFFQIGCKSPKKIIDNNTCQGKTEIHSAWLNPENEDANHKLVKSTSNYFAIHFVGSFNKDSLHIFVNNKFYSKINIEEPEEEKSKYAFVLSRRMYPEVPLLKIESIKLKRCFDLQLDEKYPLVYIWLEQDKWIVKYSNFYDSDNKKPLKSQGFNAN